MAALERTRGLDIALTAEQKQALIDEDVVFKLFPIKDLETALCFEETERGQRIVRHDAEGVAIGQKGHRRNGEDSSLGRRD